MGLILIDVLIEQIDGQPRPALRTVEQQRLHAHQDGVQLRVREGIERRKKVAASRHEVVPAGRSAGRSLSLIMRDSPSFGTWWC
jgi:hypothetical protein